MTARFRILPVALVLLLITGSQCRSLKSYPARNITDEEALEKAREVLSNYPLVDGHNDLPHQYRYRVFNKVDDIDLSQDVDAQWGPSHTDIPRLREGQVGAAFWVSYVRCNKQYQDSVRGFLEQFDVIERMIEKYPDDFELVTTAQGIEDVFAAGKIGGLIGIEGGHALDSSLGALRTMYHMGARYMTLTHNCNTPWADASPEEEPPTNEGISEWGNDLILEMNRLGMMVDLSHVSFDTMRDAIEMSQAPVIFSHSNPWALCNHVRNVPDDVLDSTAASGGIVMVTFVPGFLHCAPSDDRYADIEMVADHIEYLRDRMGVDYVGLGSDYDGVNDLPTGLEDTSKFPDLFAELVKRGWEDEDLEKLAGRNLVRVFREVEQVSQQMQESGVRPYDDLIPEEDIPEEHECRTVFDSKTDQETE